MSIIELDAVTKQVRRPRRGRQRVDPVGGERDPRPAGSQRRRQDDADADPHGPGIRDLGAGARLRRGPLGERHGPRPDLLHPRGPALPRQLHASGTPWRRRGWSSRSGTRSSRRPWSTSSGCGRKQRIKKLSRGQLSAVGVVIGLASRAPLTFFDEPYLGLDAVARQLFYDRLLVGLRRAPAHRRAVHPPHRRGQRPDRARGADRPGPGPARRGRRRPCAGAPSWSAGPSERRRVFTAGHEVLHRERRGVLRPHHRPHPQRARPPPRHPGQPRAGLPPAAGRAHHPGRALAPLPDASTAAAADGKVLQS